MAQNRDIEIGGVWANGAPDPPAEPIAENTYRNSTLTPQQVEEGWPFQKIVNSADFNEVMHRVTGLLRILEQWGVMPWSPLTTYAVGAHVLGSNNIIYKAIQATTGNDPISSPTQWENTGKGLSDHIVAQTNVHGSTNTPTANRLPQYDGSGRLKSNAPSASNDVARKAETDVVQTNLDTHTNNTSNPHVVTAAQVGSPPTSRTITAGNGLTGGGDLNADRSVALGTPGTLSGTSTNGVTTNSHTHAITKASQAQAEAGTDTVGLMDSLRTRQAIDARAIVLGRSRAEVTSHSTISSVIPRDNTIPQSNEGTLVLSASIAPKAAGNKLAVSVTIHVGANAGCTAVASLFLGAEPSARAVANSTLTGNGASVVISFQYEMLALNTSTHTFNVRLGQDVNAALALNGTGTVGALFGGTLRSFVEILEYK